MELLQKIFIWETYLNGFRGYMEFDVVCGDGYTGDNIYFVAIRQSDWTSCY